jgi:hypothetical protein
MDNGVVAKNQEAAATPGTKTKNARLGFILIYFYRTRT